MEKYSLENPGKIRAFFCWRQRGEMFFFWLDQDGKTYVKMTFHVSLIPMPSTTMAWSMGTLEGDPGYADTACMASGYGCHF